MATSTLSSMRRKKDKLLHHWSIICREIITAGRASVCDRHVQKWWGKKRLKMIKNLFLVVLLAVSLLLSASCTDNSRRAEIEQRRAALKHKQDSTLEASQRELAVVDSTLEAVKAEYERKKAEVEQHKKELRATAEELTALTQLRMRRDSLQVRWDVLGAQIKYIRMKQGEVK